MRRRFISITVVMLLLMSTAFHVSATNMDKAYDIYMAEEITVDGKLDDWDQWQYSYILLPEEESNVSHFSAYGGPEDLSAIVWFAWSPEGLYMAAEVTDDKHVLIPGVNSWQGDNIQFAFGTNNVFAPEFSFNSDGELFKTTTDSYADPSSIQFQTSVDDTKIVYEVFFPWNTITGSRPEYLPFCILFNENDGGGRVGWVEVSPGIAIGKVAQEFPILRFLDETPEPAEEGAQRPKVKDLTEKESTGGGVIVFELKVHITYPDVANHWAREAIDSLASQGILRGKGELFEPDAFMTRAELLATAVRAAGLDMTEYLGGFADVLGDEWYAGYVQAAADGQFLTDGFAVGETIRPNDIATREDMIRLFSSIYQKRSDHLDKDVGESYLETAVSAGLIQQQEDYRLGDGATRGEIATVAYRMLDAIKK